MLYRALGDALVVLHIAYVAFAVGGSVLVLRRPRLTLLHLPCALWAVLISLYGGTCPLTPLEKLLRARGGEIAYSGGFVEHYLMPALYPVGMTRDLQILLGAVVLLWTGIIYAIVLWRRAPTTFTRFVGIAPNAKGTLPGGVAEPGLRHRS